MKRRLLVFFIILAMMVAMPIIIFPLNSSVEDAQFNLAVELYRKGQYDNALIEFGRLLTEMHTSKYVDSCYLYRGNAYLALEQYASARDQFRYVVDNLKQSTYYHQSLYQLGRSEYLMGNHKRAISLFDSYVAQYPSLDYADNSLYWKAESLLEIGNRDEARRVFIDVLERYPTGNKADAARFKLKLMEIEDGLAAKEEAAPEVLEPFAADIDEEQAAQFQAREEQYRLEIGGLNAQIEQLRSEIDILKEMGEGIDEEGDVQIEEKMKALIAWENILKLKEETLNQKELQLDREFERIQRLSEEFERIDHE